MGGGVWGAGCGAAVAVSIRREPPHTHHPPGRPPGAVLSYTAHEGGSGHLVHCAGQLSLSEVWLFTGKEDEMIGWLL